MFEDYHIVETKESHSVSGPETDMVPSSLLRFYFASFPSAIKKSWAATATVSTLLGIAVYFYRAHSSKTPDEGFMNALGWQVPLVIFVCFLVLTTAYNAYRKYQRLERDNQATAGDYLALQAEYQQILDRRDTEHKEQIEGLKAVIAERQKHKLIFEVDTRNTTVRVEQADVLRIWIKLQLRFKNRDIYPMNVTGISLGFHRRGVMGQWERRDLSVLYGILRLSREGVELRKDTLENLEVPGRGVTLFYMIEGYVEIVNDQEIKTVEDLEVNDCVRVIMKSSGDQSDLVVGLMTGWSAKGNEVIAVIGGPSVDRDWARLD